MGFVPKQRPEEVDDNGTVPASSNRLFNDDADKMHVGAATEQISSTAKTVAFSVKMLFSVTGFRFQPGPVFDF